MHELGIIVHITKTLQSVAKENHLNEIGSVTLEVGEVSSIVPDYLTDCWAYYRKKFPLIEKAAERHTRPCSMAVSARTAEAGIHTWRRGTSAISGRSRRAEPGEKSGPFH